ncbi:MAG: hypothetical protein MHM6MM_009647, partial [Cercozoa sp. M6MM]
PSWACTQRVARGVACEPRHSHRCVPSGRRRSSGCWRRVRATPSTCSTWNAPSASAVCATRRSDAECRRCTGRPSSLRWCSAARRTASCACGTSVCRRAVAARSPAP